MLIDWQFVEFELDKREFDTAPETLSQRVKARLTPAFGHLLSEYSHRRGTEPEGH